MVYYVIKCYYFKLNVSCYIGYLKMEEQTPLLSHGVAGMSAWTDGLIFYATAVVRVSGSYSVENHTLGEGSGELPPPQKQII